MIPRAFPSPYAPMAAFYAFQVSYASLTFLSISFRRQPAS